MSSNQIAGTITILIAAACCGFAYNYAKKEEYSKALMLIFLLGLFLRIFAGLDFYLHAWDERYHALVARNLLEHPLVPTLYDNPVLDFNYKDWANNHIWIHKPPLTLWLIAASLKLFGINEIAVRIPSIILSSISVFLTYYIAKHFFSTKTALLASFFFAINGLLIELAVGRCPTDHVETIFIFFVELGVFFAVYYVRHPSSIALVSIGITTGCAILTKWLPGIIVVAVLFILLIQKETWKKALLHCGAVFAVAVIIFMPWQIYIYSTFPNEAIWENYFNSYRHIFEELEGHGGTIWYHLLMIPKIFGELAYIPFVLFFYAIFKKKISRGSFALVLWFVLPYLFFSFVATKMPGYVMMSAPAIFIMLSYSFIYLKEITVGSKYRKAITILLILLVILPVRYSLERIRPFRDIDRNPPWAQELRTLETRVGGGKTVVFNIEDYIEAMFFAKITAYPFIPSQEQIDQAISKGFKVYIYDSPDIPSAVRSNTHITILQHTL